MVLHEPTVFPSSGGVNLSVASHPDWQGFTRYHMAYVWRLKETHALQRDDYYGVKPRELNDMAPRAILKVGINFEETRSQAHPYRGS